MSNTISVIIPTHNRPKELQNALRSLAEQTVLPDEVIVVDDGSTVPISKEIFKILPPKIKRKLLTNKIPRGANYARNRGIKVAESKYISFLDDDDSFKSKKIEILKKEIINHPNAEVFYHKAEIYMVNEKVKYISRSRKLENNNEKRIKQFLFGNPIGGTSLVTIKKECILEVGCFDENFPAMQDRELWMRLVKANKKFWFIDRPLVNYHHITKKKSISKDLSNYYTAISLYEDKNNDEYLRLTDKEKKEYKKSKLRSLVHRHLLSNNLKMAIKSQLKLIKIHPSIRNIIVLIALMTGRNNIFKLRSLIS